jgi:FKBP-type peptidyl-prolyl cis-trans isomerase 2
MSVKKNDKISVEYEGRFENGEVFDSSKHGEHSHPLEFVAGAGQVIKGFDDAILGMKEGEEKEFSIEAKDAYGERDERLTKEIPRAALPKEHEPKEGMMLMIGSPDGRQFPTRIIAVNKNAVTIDLNHPLAGKKLIFKIKIIKIEGADEKETKSKKEDTKKQKED